MPAFSILRCRSQHNRFDELKDALKIGCRFPELRLEPFAAPIDIIIRGSWPVYSRAELSRTVSSVAALILTAVATSVTRYFRAPIPRLKIIRSAGPCRTCAG